MKRPDGFDPNVRPRTERAAERGTPKPSRPVRGDSSARSSDPDRAEPDQEATDVLDLDVARLREQRATVAPTAPKRVAAASTVSSEDVANAPTSDDSVLDPRTAAKLRRRHERQEIRRFTARKRGRHRPWVVAAAIIGALVLVSLAGAYSPLLAVRTIEVVGASRVSQAELTEALSSQLGRPLALVDAGEVKAVLVGYPLIASYSLESQPPSTLVVRIVEREPVGVLQSGTVYTLVDGAGVTIERSDQPITGYPTLMVSGGATSKGFVAAAAVVRALPAELRARVASVSATTADDVTLTLVDSPAEVVWGSAEDSAKKALMLERAMAATDPSQVNQYDLSSTSSVIVR
ncbi:FtsQ-type POTRA domain-containing protein [Plantibacter flavus]|uniref:FtsQ-type POTRA domain-containing protein n=1 Tax=Plantibacter flavus TaxID=150123 RepID=UPI003F147CD6